MTDSPTESLQAAIDRAGNAVDFLRNMAGRPHSQAVTGQFTNWQSEVESWRKSCAFLDQSHHMNDLFISGPDAVALMSRVGVNSFASFGAGKAKQLVVASPDGYYLGDVVLVGLEDNLFNLVGRRTLLDWVRYNAETGGFDVTLEHDPQTLDRGGRPPRLYRYEIQGPNAGPLMEKATGKPLPQVKFFGMTDFELAGRKVQAIRHGMAGEIGFELFGPWVDGEAVRDALFAAGDEFGLTRVGSVAYSTANLESGWVPGPLPAIFSQSDLKSYREWLPARAGGVLAGSLYTKDITDYYVTPYELGYGKIVNFDHDFIGAAALKERASQPQRKKVTLIWNADDVARVVSSMWREGPKYKYFNMPKARYGLYQVDEVLKKGRRTGISMDCGYLVNERAVVSLAVVDEEVAAPGSEVTLLWGENPNSAKPNIEPHEQTEIRATVAPVPIGAYARTTYRQNA